MKYVRQKIYKHRYGYLRLQIWPLGNIHNQTPIGIKMIKKSAADLAADELEMKEWLYIW